MQILHVVPSYLPAVRYGGPIYSVHGLCVALARRGHTVQVLTTSVDGLSDADVPLSAPVELDGVIVRYFKVPYFRRLYYAPGMRSWLEAAIRGFEIVHTHSVFLWPTWMAARVARAAAVPYVVSPRGMLVKELVRNKSRLVKTAWIELVERRNLQHAAAVHVTSEIEAQNLQQFSFRLPLSLLKIPNGVKWRDLKDVAIASARTPYVLMLGRISWVKRIDLAIESLAHMPGVHLVVAGGDDEGLTSRLRETANAYGVTDRVEFVGSVAGVIKETLLRNATALLMTSTSENFGNAVLEAMALGTPAIVVPTVGAAEIVRASSGGRVVDPAPATIATAVLEYVADPAGQERAGSAGRKWVCENASWEIIAARMEAAYSEIINRAGRG